MKSTIKTQKTYNLFPRLYGRAAYEAWKSREAEIDKLMQQRVYSRREIIELREANYRQMKLSKPDQVLGENVDTMVFAPATIAA